VSQVERLRTLDDLAVDGKVVLVRADLNVPLVDGVVTDDFRLRSAIPTIAALRRRGARVALCSHLGRPKGPDDAVSMRHLGGPLAALGGFEVDVASDVGGPDTVRLLTPGSDSVVLLENTRFEAGETKNDPALADRLASLADFFVLDAFGSAHRAHSSTAGVAERLPSAVGLLMAEELAAFDRLLHDPKRPFVVVLGGAKVSDKLGVIKTLLPKVDVMLIGGAMCFTLLAAEGFAVGNSLLEEDLLDEVRAVLDSPDGSRLSLPVDVVAADRFAADSPYRTVPATDIPDDVMGLDIGPETIARYADILRGADTIFWNGPMGVFEWEAFAAGTRAIADAVVAAPGYSVVGGGDSVAALRSFGLEGAVGYLSTGGGAGLELIEQGYLPAVEAVRTSPRGGESR
jgi:phosphoglycerate kinase